MNYVSHPYASTSASVTTLRRQNASRSHSKKASTSSACSTFLDVRASLSSPVPSAPRACSRAEELKMQDNDHRMSRRASRPRPVGLFGNSTVDIESLLREVSPVRPEIVESPVSDDSVTLTLDGLSLAFPRPPFSPGSATPSPSATHFPSTSPNTNAGNMSGASTSSSPSTPGMPLTPASSDDEYHSVAPLSISKSSNASAKVKKADMDMNSRSSSSSSRARISRVFAPLDTVAANSLSLSLHDLSLTGVLAEFSQGSQETKPIKASKEAAVEVEEDDFDPSWLDVDADAGEDADAARDYYRSDIATHLQLFSSPSFSNPFSPSSSFPPQHKRQASSTSSQSHYFPPARPDSMPPPPHFQPSTHNFGRRASASSLASNASKSSARSNRSTASQGSLRFAAGKASKRTSRARLSARAGVSKRRSSVGVNAGKPLPPTPHTAELFANAAEAKGPSPLLDPSFPRAPKPAPPLPSPSPIEFEFEERQQQPERRRTRPPPRSSLPIDIGFDFPEDFDSENMDDESDHFFLGSNSADADPFEEVYVEIGGGDGDEEAVMRRLRAERLSRDSMSSTISHRLRKAPSRLLPRAPGINISLTIPEADEEEDTESNVAYQAPARTPSPARHTAAAADVPFSPTSMLDSPISPSQLTPSPSASAKFFNSSNSPSAFASGPGAYLPGTPEEHKGETGIEREERILRSRWSMSTMASIPPPSSSSSRSIFPKLQLQLPRFAKSPKSSSGASVSGRSAKSNSSRKSSESQANAPPLPFPFFPQPTPPSPTKKKSPGPGPYIPKPQTSPGALPPTPSSTTSLRSSSSGGSSSTAGVSPSATSRSPRAQYAQYASYKQSQAQAQVQSPYQSSSQTDSRARTLSSLSFAFVVPTSSSPPPSSASSSSGSSCGGHGARYAPASSSSGTASPTRGIRRSASRVSHASHASDMSGESSGGESTGLRRKPIPVEIFMRS